MKQTEDKISFAYIKQYLLLLKNDWNKFGTFEFRTIGEWLAGSLAVVFIICTPCTLILLVSGYFSDVTPFSFLMSLSLIPFIYILPIIFILTYIKNYRKPKRLRIQMLQVLERCDWDGPVEQVDQAEFECFKNRYLFKTEARQTKDEKGVEKWVIYIFVPFHIPDEAVDRAGYLQQIDTYLKGKCRFDLDDNIAYIAAPVGLFSTLDLRKDIEQLLYIMQRFHLHPRTLFSPHAIVKQIPQTIELLALTIYKQEIDDRWPAWARNLLDAGFSNENLTDFARQIPQPGNQQELREQMNQIIMEFNLDAFCGKYTLCNYINFLTQKKLQQEMTIPEIVGCLNNLYVTTGMPDLQNFNLLYKAVKALSETGEQDIWTATDLSAGNMDDCVLTYLYTFLEEADKEQTAS